MKYHPARLEGLFQSKEEGREALDPPSTQVLIPVSTHDGLTTWQLIRIFYEQEVKSLFETLEYCEARNALLPGSYAVLEIDDEGKKLVTVQFVTGDYGRGHFFKGA